MLISMFCRIFGTFCNFQGIVFRLSFQIKSPVKYFAVYLFGNRTTPEQAGTTRSITFYNVYAHIDLGKPEINCPAQEMRFSLRDFFSTFKQVLSEITYVSEQGFRNHTIFKNNVLR